MKTLDEVRKILSVIEPDESMYQKLDAGDTPQLQQLVGGGEAWMSARAVHAAARLQTPGGLELVRAAAADGRPEVRTAVASAAGRLPPMLSHEVLDKLLDDGNVSVRKLAVRSAGGLLTSVRTPGTAVSPALEGLRMKLQGVAVGDAHPVLRELAKQGLGPQ